MTGGTGRSRAKYEHTVEEGVVNFGRPLNYDEVLHAFQEFYNQTGLVTDLEISEIRNIGISNPQQRPPRERTSVRRVLNRRVTGKTSSPDYSESLSFALSQSFGNDWIRRGDDFSEDLVYTILRFNVTPGYGVGELKPHSQKIRTSFEEFFGGYIPGDNPNQGVLPFEEEDPIGDSSVRGWKDRGSP